MKRFILSKGGEKIDLVLSRLLQCTSITESKVPSGTHPLSHNLTNDKDARVKARSYRRKNESINMHALMRA